MRNFEIIFLKQRKQKTFQRRSETPPFFKADIDALEYSPATNKQFCRSIAAKEGHLPAVFVTVRSYYQ